MICETCKAEGKTSTVKNLGSSHTLMGYTPYYDEQGVYHNHDANTKRTAYECSNGHAWSVESQGSCKCGWSGGPTVIVPLHKWW